MICTAKISGQIDRSANYVSVGNCLLRVYADCSMSSMSGVADERESARSVARLCCGRGDIDAVKIPKIAYLCGIPRSTNRGE
jgi:hypothetical protein